MTNFLMISMIDLQLLADIQAKAGKIENPKDYFAGTPAPNLSLPQNILLFHRNKKSKVQESAKHHRFLLMINCQGEGDVILNGQRFHLKIGQGLLVFPFQHHHYANQNEPMFWLKITFELPSTDALESLRDSVFTYTPDTLAIIEKLSEIYNYETFKQPYFSNQLTFLLAALLNEINQLSLTRINKTLAINQQTPLVDNINQHIIKNIHTPLSITEIAKKFHYSESHLRALYRNEMKLSIGAYIQEIRIHKSQEYLGSTDLPISEIAELCGYSSLYVFSNAFKKQLKTSPLKYRKKLKEQ